MRPRRPTFLVYGATGYSGRLIVAEACSAADPRAAVIAGRDEEHWLSFPATIQVSRSAHSASRMKSWSCKNFAGIDVVINAAGPFATTWS